MSTSSRCLVSLEPARAQEETGPIPGAGNDERSKPQQAPRENGENEPSRRERSFALEQWLAKPRKDEPFNTLASARAPASDQDESVQPPPEVPIDGPSSVGYMSNATSLSNADKIPGR